jgi:chloramphenicol-sensitive protein RarD
MLMTAGIATTVPLLLFGAAAIRLPLVVLGVLQYLAPVIQFLLGVTYFGEQMPPERWAGFALVWLALVVFTVDVVRHSRRPVAEAPL